MKTKLKNKKRRECKQINETGGVIYGLGFIGAMIYYISTASSFWFGFLGILKAMIWPLFLIYEVLKFVGA